jgi:hypothetical protein
MASTIATKLQSLLRSLLYEYRLRADWGKEQGYIIKERINRWTRQVTILEERVIRCGN